MGEQKKMEPLYKKIFDDLQTKIKEGAYKAGDLLPTENELCSLYRVSRITAMRALNELKAQGLIARKKKKGSIVLSQNLPSAAKAQTIAVVFSDFDNFEKKIVSALSSFAQKKNCTIITFDSKHSQKREREILLGLAEKIITGLILWPITRASNLDVLNRFVQKNIPICFLDYSSYGIKAPCVCSDNYAGMYNITKHLIHLGHTRIAYFPYKENFLPTEEERFSAYCRAIVKNGAELQPEYFIPMPEDIKNTTTENADRYGYCAQRAITYLLSLKTRPTAVVCVNDATACHIARCAREAGLRVPEDLSVTGFDNIALALENDITTVSQDFGEMAKLALNLLIRQLADPSLINNCDVTSRLRSVIWERGSTAKRN